MATIKSYTDIEQSRKLAEILPLESADMVYFGIHQGIDGKYYLSGTNTEDDVVPIYKNFCIKVFAKTTASDVINQLPCWSLTALLSILTENKICHYNNRYYCQYMSEGDEFPIYSTAEYDNPVDACVAMIEKLHELKML